MERYSLIVLLVVFFHTLFTRLSSRQILYFPNFCFELFTQKTFFHITTVFIPTATAIKAFLVKTVFQEELPSFVARLQQESKSFTSLSYHKHTEHGSPQKSRQEKKVKHTNLYHRLSSERQQHESYFLSSVLEMYFQ